MSAEVEALRLQVLREWDEVIRLAWKAEVVVKDLAGLVKDPSEAVAGIVRKRVLEVEEKLGALEDLADALDPPPAPPEPPPGMSSLMRKKDIAEHIARQFRCHLSTCTEGATEARKLARWSGKPNKALLKRLRYHAGALESAGRHILKALEEYEKADVVYPDFAIDGIPVDQMGKFVSLLAGTLPGSDPEEEQRT